MAVVAAIAVPAAVGARVFAVGDQGESVAATSERAADCPRAWTIDRRVGGAVLRALALDASGVWAVGRSGGNGLVLRRVHGRWSSTTIGAVDEFTDVAARGGEVWTVGSFRPNADTYGSALFRRSGGRWRRVVVAGVPDFAHGFSFSALALHGGDVWAVGGYDNSHWAGAPVDDATWLAARRQGARWRTWRGKTYDAARLTAVSVLAGDDGWAVGRSGVTIASQDEVIVHWNGARWLHPPRATADEVAALNDVLALSHDNAWAVGVPRTEGVSNPPPVIEHWDGRAWTRVRLPRTRGSSLNALAAFGADDVWAGGGSARPTLLHWDGSRWRTAPAPAIAAPILELAAAHDGTLWAVGRGFVAYSRCR